MTVWFSPRSQCDGKIRYLRRVWAKQAIVAMAATGCHVTGMSAYRCEHCGFFHIGHRPPMEVFDARRP